MVETLLLVHIVHVLDIYKLTLSWRYIRISNSRIGLFREQADPLHVCLGHFYRSGTEDNLWKIIGLCDFLCT